MWYAQFLQSLKINKTWKELARCNKVYVNYQVWHQWGLAGVFYLTRLNENATYEVLTGQPLHVSEYADGGVISDQIIQLGCVTSRLVVYKDPERGNVLRFVTNLMDFQASTICILYRSRWSIEVLFKSIKQNFELAHFFSDSAQGIQSQVWVALIANLLFRVIHRRTRECELFTTIVSMAAKNMGSYLSFIHVISFRPLDQKTRNIQKIQLELGFDKKGGVSEHHNKSP